MEEYRTVQSVRMLIEKIAKLTSSNISELLMARYDLTRELNCASEKDRKFLVTEIDKLDQLILKLWDSEK